MKKILLAVFLCVASFGFGGEAQATYIPEGAIIKTPSNPDVYIVKYQNGKQYKRLVLNPQVFQSYGHLRWEDLLVVSTDEMESFTTSSLVRVDGTSQIWALEPNGDNGEKYKLVNASPINYDQDRVYTINSVDFNNYTYKGELDVDELSRDYRASLAIPVIEALRELLEEVETIEDINIIMNVANDVDNWVTYGIEIPYPSRRIISELDIDVTSFR